MAEEIKKETNIEVKPVVPAQAVTQVKQYASNNQGPMGGAGAERKKIVQRRVQRNDRPQRERQNKEFETEIISIKRVTKVTGGGKKMRMSVFVVIGDKKGKVGLGIGKGADVKSAEGKAIDFAKRRMIMINLKGNTIPHTVTLKMGAAKIFMKPAAPGTGVIAGGPVRKVLEVAGVKDVLTKQIGTSNQVMNAYCTLEALKLMKISKPQ
ncbi:MAG: 30S ribosomal protein S5 [bacterium]